MRPLPTTRRTPSPPPTPPGPLPRGRRSSSSTRHGSTGWPTASLATCTTPRTSPKTCSSGCSGRRARTRRAPSRAGCTGSRPTSSSTRCAASSASGSTLSRRTPRAGWPAASPARPRRSTTPTDDDVQKALDALPPDFRAAVVLCDIEGPPTRRSPRRSVSSSGPYAPASTVVALSFVRRWPTAHRSVRWSRRPPLPVRRSGPPGCCRGAVTSHLGMQVSAYVDRRLDARVLHAFDQHLAVCLVCRLPPTRSAAS